MKLIEFLKSRLDSLIEKEASEVNEIAKSYFFLRRGSVESPEEPYINAFAGFKEKDREKWEKTWNTMTKGKVHKWTACVKKMKGKVDNPEAYCSALAKFVGYDPKTGKKSKKKKSKSKKKKKGSVELIYLNYLPQYIKEKGFENAYKTFESGSVFIKTDTGVIPGAKFASLMRKCSAFFKAFDSILSDQVKDVESRRFISFVLGLKAASVKFLRSASKNANSIEKIATVLDNYEVLRKIIASFTRFLLTNDLENVKKISSLFPTIPKLESEVEKENLKNILSSVDMKKLCHKAMLFVLAQAEEPGTDLGKEKTDTTTTTTTTTAEPTTTDPNTGKPVEPQEQMKKDQKYQDCKNRLSPYLGEEAADETCKTLTSQN